MGEKRHSVVESVDEILQPDLSFSVLLTRRNSPLMGFIGGHKGHYLGVMVAQAKGRVPFSSRARSEEIEP